MKLGTLLLRNAVITLSQLETALRTQVVYGGRLGTNLVELGFIDVDSLSEYLADSLDVPVATQAMFEAVAQHTIDLFGTERARRFEAFPLADPQQPDDVLPVAVIDPRATHEIEQLATELSVRVVPYVAPELRIYYYLEKHYGITRKARYVRVGSQDDRNGVHHERRRTQPAGGIEMPTKVLFRPTKARSESSLGHGVNEATTESVVAREATTSYREACVAIDRARHRDAIGDVFMQYARGRFAVAAVFLLRDNNALGWRLYHDDPRFDDYPIEELSLPLGPSSVLQIAHDTGKPYRGGPLSAGKPTERQLWAALDIGTEPQDMAVIPVTVKLRVVNLVYVHTNAGSLDDDSVKRLDELAIRAGKAYIRLITSAKQQVRSS